MPGLSASNWNTMCPKGARLCVSRRCGFEGLLIDTPSHLPRPSWSTYMSWPWRCMGCVGFELAFVQFEAVRGMPYVGAGVVVVDVYADATVGAEVDDVPFRVVWIGVVLLLSEEEDRIVVVALEGGAVHGEKFVPCLVDDLVDDKVIGYAWLGKSDGVVRHSIVERILDISQ